jgi:hypothetical protein
LSGELHPCRGNLFPPAGKDMFMHPGQFWPPTSSPQGKFSSVYNGILTAANDVAIL